MPSARRFRRFLRLLVRATALVAVLLVVAWLFRGSLLAPFVLERISTELREQTGAEIRIAELRGSWLASIELRGVETVQEGTLTPLRSLDAALASAEYSLIGLALGHDDWLGPIKVVNGRVALDLTQGSEPSETTGESAGMPQQLPALELSEVEFDLTGDGFHVRTGSISARIALAPVGNTGRLEVSRFQLRAGDRAWAAETASADINWQGDRLTLASIMVDGQSVGEAGIAFASSTNAAMTMHADLDAFGGKWALQAEVGDESAELQISTKGVDPAQLAGVGLASGPAGALDLNATASIPLDEPITGAFAVDLHFRHESGDLTLAAELAPGASSSAWMQRLEARLGANVSDLADALTAAGVLLPEGYGLAPNSTLAFEGTLDGTGLELRQFELRSESFDATLTEASWRPADTAQPLAAGSGRGQILFDLKQPEALPFSQEWPAFRAASTITATLSDTEAFTLDALRAELNGLDVQLAGQLATATGTASWASEALSADLELTVRDLQAWHAAALPPLPFDAGSIEARLTASGTLADPALIVVAKGTGLTARETEFRLPHAADLELHAIQRQQQLTLEKLRCTAPGIEFSATGRCDWPLDLTAESLSLPDAGTADATFAFERPAEWLPQAISLPVEAERVQGDLSVSGPFADPTVALKIAVDNARPVEGNPWSVGQLAASLNGKPLSEASSLAATIDSFVGMVQGERIELREPAAITIRDRQRIETALLSIAAGGGEASLKGWVQLETGALSGDTELTLDGVTWESQRLPDMRLAAGLDGNIATIHSLTANWSGARVELSGALPLDIQGSDLLAAGNLDLKASVVAADAGTLTSALPDWPFAAGALAADCQVSGSWSAPVFAGSWRGDDLAPAGAPTTVANETASGSGAFRYADGVFHLDALDVNHEKGFAKATAAWPVHLDLRALQQGTPLDTSQPLQGSVNLEMPDLSWLAALIPSLRRAGGAVAAELAISGPLDALHAEGAVRLRDGALRLEDPALSSLERLNGTVRFAGRSIVLEEFTGALGGAPFAATGTVAYPVDAEPDIELRLTGTDLLLYRQDGVKVRADADLRVEGSLAALRVGGKLNLTDARFVKPVDFLDFSSGNAAPPTPEGLSLFSMPDPPLRDMQFDIAIAGTGFRLKNNVLNGAVRPDLKLKGTGETPYLEGSLYVEPTSIKLPGGNLAFQSGIIEFLPGKPFEPQLDITGGARRLGYDITMAVRGPYDEPTVTFASVPPLPQDQLLLLVLTGQSPDVAASGKTANRALGQVAIYLARDIASGLFGDVSTESDESLLERFEIETGRDATRQGAETIESRFLLVRNVFVEGDLLFLEGEQDAFGDFNLGLEIRFRF